MYFMEVAVGFRRVLTKFTGILRRFQKQRGFKECQGFSVEFQKVKGFKKSFSDISQMSSGVDEKFPGSQGFKAFQRNSWGFRGFPGVSRGFMRS